MDDLVQDALVALVAYWTAAVAEGTEGRTHDTPDGAAANALHRVMQAVRAYATAAVLAERERAAPRPLPPPPNGDGHGTPPVV